MIEKLIFWIIVFSLPSHAATVTVFVAPDSSFSALKDFLQGAKELKIATYTFTVNDIAELLHANATILVDASPVGGFPQESKAIFCKLAKNRINVYLYNGPYRFMHAKYIIKGNAALISSENLGDDGFPKNPNHGNRGWGVVVEDENIARQLNDIFLYDLKDAKPFVCDGNYTLQGKQLSGNYNSIFKPQQFDNQSVSLIIAPNALQPLLDLISSAQSRILVEQFYIYRYFDRKTQSDNPLLEALINATRRNINVSILLDSFYYNVEGDDPASNLYTNEYLNNISSAENLPLRSRLIDLDNGLLKLHNKGLIVDNSVLISSINWNENSPTRNREVGIIIKGEAAKYFSDVFNHDFYPENRITGLAAARNYIGIGLVILVIILLVWIRKQKPHNSVTTIM